MAGEPLGDRVVTVGRQLDQLPARRRGRPARTTARRSGRTCAPCPSWPSLWTSCGTYPHAAMRRFIGPRQDEHVLRLPLIVTVSASMLLGPSCGRACNEIGCGPSVGVTFPDVPRAALPLEVTVCVDEQCQTTLIDPEVTEPTESVFAEVYLADGSERRVGVHRARGLGRQRGDAVRGKGQGRAPTQPAERSRVRPRLLLDVALVRRRRTRGGLIGAPALGPRRCVRRR